MEFPADGTTSLVDILRGLRGLGRSGTVLQVGAHPDDEDAGLLALVARRYATRVVYWSATRGEGGQNFVGRERGEELGILRTWESLQARRIDGAESLFGPFIDFGYSKTAAETLRRWGHEAVVREMVRAIRLVQPLVLVSRWSGEARDEHGHHRAVGQLAEEAFYGAGDASRFPELGALGLPPWQPARFYVSMDGDWQPGQDVQMGARRPEIECAGYARVDPGEYDPWLRRSYQSLAWEAFANHRSQGVAVPPEWGSHYYYYRIVCDEDDKKREFHRSLFAGLDVRLQGLARRIGQGVDGAVNRLEEVEIAAVEAERRFLGLDPVAAGRSLVPARRTLVALIEATDRAAALEPGACAALRFACARLRTVVDGLIVACLGLHLEGRVDVPRVTPAQRFTVASRLWNPLGCAIEPVRIDLSLPLGSSVEALQSDPAVTPVRHSTVAAEIRHAVQLPRDTELSCPYWLEADHDGFRYAWPDRVGCGAPFSPDSMRAVATFEFEGERIEFSAAPVHVETVDVGFRRVPVSVVPPVMLDSPHDRQVLAVSDGPHEIELVVGACAGSPGHGVEGTLSVVVPEGWTARPQTIDLRLSPAAGRQRVITRLRTPANLAAGRYDVDFAVLCEGREYDQIMSTVRLDGTGARVGEARDEHVLRQARVSVDVVDVGFARGYVHGYVEGADEGVLESLQRLGVPVQSISEGTLRHGDLDAFETIVVGANAYVLRPEVREASARLLGFVNRGGTLVVQHQGYPYERMSAAPYRFSYSRPHDRVTAPDAPVRIQEPDHPALAYPNRITARDFEGWVRDRGLYFFGEWDPHYRPLLSSHDPDELPHEGGLLIAPYGRGTFVYSGLSFFRQVPAGVHGAIRLLANLMSLPAALARERMELLQATYLFSELPKKDLDAVARLTSEASFPGGAVIACEGDPGDELFLIVSGEVEIVRRDAGDQPIYRAVAGELVGELAVLSHIPRTATMRARGDTRLLMLRGQHLQELTARHPEVGQAMIRILADKLAHGAVG